MAITVVFDPPLPTDPPATFDSKAFTLLGDLNDWSAQANAVANQINGAQPNLDIVAGNIGNINAAVADLPALSAKVSKTGDTMTGNLNVPSINGGQLAGMRNKIINGAFSVNQRVYVSGAATIAGQYTLDRWKVTGTGGITFSTTANKTTVTIPSGQTILQVIEDLNLQTGTYVLSWEGTAQGRIGGGSYGASGAVTASITGGTNTTIEFNSGTVANVQLELGTIATPFEHRPYGAELALCQRYYEKSYRQSLAPGATTGVTSADALCFGDFPASTVLYVQAPFLVEKRGVPTLRVWDAVGNIDRCTTQADNNQLPSAGALVRSVSTRSFNTDFSISGMKRLVALCWDASAEL